jgi:hypothetical protein
MGEDPQQHVVAVHRESTVAPSPSAVRPVESTAVVRRAERRTAVAHWLLSAAPDPTAARAEWERYGIATLACGGIFSAVRAPGDLVFAAAGVEGPAAKASLDAVAAVDVYLGTFLDGGAVVMDVPARLYYFLVPAHVSRWDPREFPGVECLGSESYLGVPLLDQTLPEERAYWAVEPDGPGALCWPDEVVSLLHRGQAALGGPAPIPRVPRLWRTPSDDPEEPDRVS